MFLHSTHFTFLLNKFYYLLKNYFINVQFIIIFFDSKFIKIFYFKKIFNKCSFYKKINKFMFWRKFVLHFWMELKEIYIFIKFCFRKIYTLYWKLYFNIFWENFQKNIFVFCCILFTRLLILFDTCCYFFLLLNF